MKMICDMCQTPCEIDSCGEVPDVQRWLGKISQACGGRASWREAKEQPVDSFKTSTPYNMTPHLAAIEIAVIKYRLDKLEGGDK